MLAWSGSLRAAPIRLSAGALPAGPATLVMPLPQRWTYENGRWDDRSALALPGEVDAGRAVGGGAVTERGVLGDRAYALFDHETGTIATAKHPRRWPALLACSARFVSPPTVAGPLPAVAITLPDGVVVSSDDADVDARLSDTFGREVSLVSTGEIAHLRDADRTPLDAAPDDLILRREPLALGAPPGTFFDYGPLHLLTTATLAFLQARHPTGQFDPRRFRPNMLLAVAGDTLVEHGWLGTTLTLGDTAQVFVMDPASRCVVTTLAQGELPRDVGVLRTVTAHSAAPSVTAAPGVVFPAVAGVYARVTRPGRVRRQDAITAVPARPGEGP